MTQHLQLEYPNTFMASNDLLDGAFLLPIFEMKLINLAISKIEPNKPQPLEGYKITAKEFMDIYDYDENAIFRCLKNASKTIHSNPIRLYNYFWEGKVRDFIELSWCTVISYTSSRFNGGEEGAVNIKFSPEIEPFLFEIQKRFTQLNFNELAKLDTPFSIRLYLWLYSKKWKGRSVELDIEWMKKNAGIQDKYDEYKPFRVRVIEPAVERINHNTSEFLVEFEPIKTGRSYTAIRFNLLPRDKGLSEKPKPIRPRLPRRPKVKSGSHEEGIWARAGIKVLTDYLEKLKEFSDKALLDLKDVERLIKYYQIIGNHKKEQFWREHSKSRAKKKV